MELTPRDIEALATYRGADPRPADFEEFWASRMAEADAVPLAWQVGPASIPPTRTCEYFDLWFTGMGGARLYAKYLRPRLDGPLPLVLQFHGYPGATRSWFEQSSFVGMGCALIALDNPGQGGRSEDVGGFVGTTVAGHLVAGADGPPEGLYYVRLYQDLRILCRIVRALGEQGAFDLSRIFVNGASQGGGMGIACCALNPDLVSRAAILYPFLSDFRRVSELGADEVAYEGLRYWSRWFDPDGTRSDLLFDRLAYYDTKNFASMVRCPVQFGTGLADGICPPETQCAVYNGLSCERRRLLYPGFGHEEIAAFDDETLSFFGTAIGGMASAPAEVAACGEAQRATGDALPASSTASTRRSPAPAVAGDDLALGNAHARYRELRVAHDGVVLAARYVCPATSGPHPLVVLYADLDRPMRGWHHLTRYVGAGHAVLHVPNRTGASVDTFPTVLEDARAVLDVAMSSLDVDAGRVIVFGEGFGGALALGVAAQRAVRKAAALNPYPASPLRERAARVGCPVLLGTSGLDELAPAAEQDAIAACLTEVTQKHYPKYAHERVNAFEDELLAFVNA